ncbi:MAG: recombinase family protein [Clostridia bacterium]|nr:recombinase family protein [Clostridia bacterium]
MRGVLYLRKSRADDPKESVEDTLRRHEDTLRGLAKEQNVTLCGIYREVASGDSLAGREEMQRLLKDCQTGDFQAVLCMDIDRLGRGSMAEQGYILDTFKRAGVQLVTPRKTFDLNNDIDETYSEFESFIARQELKAIKRRLQRGVQRSAAEGSFLSAPPYGYQRDTVAGHPSLRPEPHEAEAVVLAFRLYAEQGLGCPEIAQRLGSMGYLPRRGAAFSRSTVGAILQNPVYVGRVVRRGATAIDTQGLHPPLVSHALFDAAARRRQGRAHTPTTPRVQQNPLAGLVLCGCCGAKLQRLPPSPTRRQETLACPRTGCNRAIKLSLVERAVRGVLLHHLPASIASAALPPPPSTAGRQREVARQEERLYQLLEQGVYTPAEFRQRRQVLAEQKAALTATAAEPTPPALISTAEAYDTASPAARNRLLKEVFKKILYTKASDGPADSFELELYLRE